MTIRLMLADDHRMLREGLSRSMRDEGFDVVAEARNGAEAVQLATQVKPCLLYTSPSPRDATLSRMPSSA